MPNRLINGVVFEDKENNLDINNEDNNNNNTSNEAINKLLLNTNIK